jgi:hypothetical protein
MTWNRLFSSAYKRLENRRFIESGSFRATFELTSTCCVLAVDGGTGAGIRGKPTARDSTRDGDDE